MKLKRGYLLRLFVLLFVMHTSMIEVNAMNTGFKANDLPTEEITVFISNCNILRIDEEPVKKTIKCFDVKSNGLIAVGQNALDDKKIICIYSNEGVFQYGYTFNCSGAFGIEWDGDNLNIYFIRSAVIVSVTPSGEILEVLDVPNSIENNSYVNHFILATERTVGDTQYSIRSNIGILNILATSYSQVVAEDITGAERIIYDVRAMQLSSMIATLVVVCASVSIIVWQLFVKIRRGN